MVHPTRGDRRRVFGFDEVREGARDQERAERLRLYYVAMTRAIDRLIVSGAIDLDRTADRETPIGWVLERLGARDSVADAGRRSDRARARRRALRPAGRPVSADDAFADARRRPRLRRRRSADELQLALFDELPAGVRAVGIELPRSTRSRRPRSTTCAGSRTARSRSSSAARIATSPSGWPGSPPVATLEAYGETGGGLAATEIGDAVHRLLELVPLDEPGAPPRAGSSRRARLVSRRDRRPSSIASPLSSMRTALAISPRGSPAFRARAPSARSPSSTTASSSAAGSTSSGRTASERSSSTTSRTRSRGATPAEIVEAEYGLQRLVYALVCLRAGADEVEVAYQFLERPDDVVSTSFSRDDVAALEAELSAAIARIRAGDFRPTPSEFACADCPALDLVCAGPRLGTAR